jgi:hypothetical protein
VRGFLEFGNNNLVVNNISTSDLDNREIPVVLEGDIDLSNSVILDEKDIYVGIDFFPENLKNYIPDKNRQHDYVFQSNYVSEDETELIFPAHYKITSLPETINEKSDDYAVTGSYTAKANKITFKKTLSFNSGRIRKEDFNNWTAFIRKLKDFNSNLIVVQKP